MQGALIAHDRGPRSALLSVSGQALLATWAVKTVFMLELAFRHLYPSLCPTLGYEPSEPELAGSRQTRATAQEPRLVSVRRLSVQDRPTSIRVHFCRYLAADRCSGT